MNKEIPWTRIVSYHKEITKRAEEAFFSLVIKNDHSERWSSLIEFNPEQLSGPWETSIDRLNSRDLLRNIKNNDVRELYLGGPCYFKWKKEFRGKFQLYWEPVLYREVKVLIDDSEQLIIQPEQGNWEVSPLVHQYLDNKNVCLEESIDSIIKKVIEKTHEALIKSEINLTKTLIEYMIKEIPELEDVLMAEFPRKNQLSRPGDWILFTPAEASALTRNLVSDYTVLEKNLDRNPDAIGGLRLLSPEINHKRVSVNNEINILPIVPLNYSQKSAVEGILKKNPVTVISGPPGCGKSQVVLSVLLNSWAAGDSVLFASNNNQAVDVVRERLKPLEDVFPISIRAGARNHSNVEEIIRRVMNAIVYSEETVIENECEEVERQDLIKQKSEIESHLESKLPQIISQSVHSAINAYGELKQTQEEIEEIERQIIQKLRSIGYDEKPKVFVTTTLQKLEKWLADVDSYRNRIDETTMKQERYRAGIEKLHSERQNLYASLGGNANAIDQWQWLSNSAPLDKQHSWYERYKKLLESQVEEKLRPFTWSREFEFWRDEQDANQWIRRAKNACDQINKSLIKWEHQINGIEQVRFEYDSARNGLDYHGLTVYLNISEELINEWIKTYSIMITLPRNKLDWFPFSTKSKYLRMIQKIENELRDQIPITVWREIGVMNEQGREKFCVVAEAVQKWQLIDKKWNDMQPLRQQIDNCFNRLKEDLKELRYDDIPKEWNPRLWKESVKQIENRIDVAQKAANAYSKKKKFDECKESIENICREFLNIGIGLPIREIWFKHGGENWLKLMNKGASDFSPEDVPAMKQLIYEGTMDTFLNIWDKLNHTQQTIDESEQYLAEIPSEKDIISEWWKCGPDNLPIEIEDLRNLPSKDHELFAHLKQCKEWKAQWIHFAEDEYPKLLEKVKQESDRAMKKLNDVSDKIPEGHVKKEFMKIIEPVLQEKQKEWPLPEIAKSVDSFSPEKLEARIKGIDAKLEMMTFKESRLNRIEALRNDPSVQRALEKLKGHYTRGRGRLDAKGYDDFLIALKALPIWITTALSTQALPMRPDIFDLLVIDEATQCSLTNLLPLIYRAKRIAVIGDPEQLTAINTISISAETALAAKYNIFDWINEYGHANNDVYHTTVNTLPRLNADVISLMEHYRSHPLIIGFSNQHVYQKRLKLRKNPDQVRQIPMGSGVYGLDVRGACQRGDRQSSWVNSQEAEKVCRLIEGFKTKNEYAHFSIGVVSPFRAQTEKIADYLEQMQLSRGVTVGTVHKYQGDERDIIIFSPVVAKGITESAARWVENPRNLINVAVTRAREGFYLVADFYACRKQAGILGELTRYVEQVSELRKTSLYELDLYSWMVVSGLNPEVHCRIADIEVDFVLSNQANGIKLAIEVDGSQHNGSKAQDSARDAFLVSRGYDVLRFSTRDVSETPAKVISEIEKAYRGKNH